MRMSSVLLRPMLIARRRVAWVLGHFVPLLRVRGVGRRIGRTRCGYGRIYRYLGVRLYMWGVMMVILVSILQGHGRTCCLSHTDCTGVTLLRSVSLSRSKLRLQRAWTRREWIDAEVGRRRGDRGELRRSYFWLRAVRCNRCGI